MNQQDTLILLRLLNAIRRDQLARLPARMKLGELNEKTTILESERISAAAELKRYIADVEMIIKNAESFPLT